MRRFLLTVVSALPLFWGGAQAQDEMRKIKVYDGVVFYDGYLMDKNPDKDLDDGVLRHSCSLYSVKLTDEQLDALGENLNLNVSVQACCDNYDRIGNINIAFVPKGKESYTTDEVDRIEIGRFITPFMDKNKEPDIVPYSYEINYLSPILRDKGLREKYVLWLEYELFGVPYAANEQIEGCAGRSDVFKGSLEFETSAEPAPATEGNLLIPIVIKTPEHLGSNLNNYNEQGTDTIGKCIKTYYFDVPQDVTGGQIVLITSNHGANSGGEEYNRRWHYVHFDDEKVLSYKPGRESCEPFRKYNTQANGIYGWSEMSDAEWQSFSNWCPGDVIDNRIIYLGDVKAGAHKVMIRVPSAKFNEKKGDIPVSMYFHGAVNGVGDAGIHVPEAVKPRVNVSVADGMLSMEADAEILAVELFSAQGDCVYKRNSASPVPVDGYAPGMYLVNVYLADGMILTHKVMLP